MKRKLKLDEKDFEIISLVQENPEISQKEIAEKVGLSQPSISARLRKLKKMRVIAINAGVDISKMGLFLAKIDLTTKNAIELLDKLAPCPYFVSAYATSGRNNLSIFLMGEDLSTLESIAEYRLRSNPDILDVNFSVVIASRGKTIYPVRLIVKKQKEAPCNLDCSVCPYYSMKRCLGCPITGYYKGGFWKVI